MTLRHDVKTFLGDSWSSPPWAVVLPGGVGVDLTNGWSVEATFRKRDGSIVHTYEVSEGITLGQADVRLAEGEPFTTSTVTLHHTGNDSANWPALVGTWDCEIRNGGQVYTIARGTMRTVGDVTRP